MPEVSLRHHVDSEVEQLRMRLHDLESEVERSRRLAVLGTLVGGVAHEFNNVMTPVLAYIELAKANPDDAELSRRAMDCVAAGLARARSIADAILSLADAGGPLHRCADVRAAALEAVDPVRPLLTASWVELEMDIPEGVVAAIDPVALRHVLLNLAMNAHRAMKGGGKLCIRSSTCNSHVLIEVEDNGPGVPPALAQEVFEPLVSSGGGGKGLGLALVRHFIQQAGGTVALASSGAGGACFVIRLPLASPPSQRMAA